MKSPQSKFISVSVSNDTRFSSFARIVKNRTLPILFMACLPAFSELPNSAVAVNNTPSANSQDLRTTHEKPGMAPLAPEDLNARGIELENTFYEIDGRPPYALPDPASASPNESAVPQSRVLPQKMMKPSWSIWAAGAAGLVGLGAIGYLTLSDDASKTPEKKVTLIVDK